MFLHVLSHVSCRCFSVFEVVDFDKCGFGLWGYWLMLT